MKYLEIDPGGVMENGDLYDTVSADFLVKASSVEEALEMMKKSLRERLRAQGYHEAIIDEAMETMTARLEVVKK